jgi:hypothetical protein
MNKQQLYESKDFEILENLKDIKVWIEDLDMPWNLPHTIDILISKYTPEEPKGKQCQMYCSACGRRIRDGRGNCLTRDIRCQRCGQIIDWDRNK